MTRPKPPFQPEYLYFITTKIAGGKPIFRRPSLAQMVIGSLQHMREQGWIKLHAYVVMPNHIHLVVRFLNDHTPSQVMRDFKKFTARCIVQQLMAEGETNLLSFFQQAVTRPTRQRHKVWEDGFFDKQITSEEVFLQKVEYIHHNPVQDHWRLASNPEEYPYSSARNYLLGDHSVIQIDMLEELFASTTDSTSKHLSHSLALGLKSRARKGSNSIRAKGGSCGPR